ncbi:succinylglutamate desuccinylase/aspartoacylase family protein [Devosia sp. 1566]|uniref:succinylglutamate desuccinylase/aspartoacylase family protein n=1 Tax=Devosia sp. 1566 TaxID=2499144 RepID=UPI000FD807B2|nr:succinylglutamate desuccinylase/aspartoacylase family protein [Devosia sp. 1566]
MTIIEVGSARAEQPGRFDGTLKLGVFPDGQPVETPVVIVRGKADGPVLWMHAAVHGNEYCGTFNIHAFLRTLDPQEMSGTVIALPALNITAFRDHRRMSPLEGFNNGDMNRCFPGKANGGFTEQMAFAVYQELKKYATHLVDFHTAYTQDTRWALYAGVDGVAEEGNKMARAFGYANCLPTPAGTLVGSAMMTAAADNIPAFIIEAGGIETAFSREIVDDVAERLRNLCRAVGLLPGEVTDYGPLTLFSNFHWATAPRGGIFKPAVSSGQQINEGDVVGTYYNLFGEADGSVTSPASGIVLAYHPGPIIPQGDVLIHVGLNPTQN